VSQDQFDKEFLNVDQICQLFNELNKDLLKINRNLNIIVTVSPVRHVRDGLENNAYSKSLLRVACQEMVNTHINVHYFPSYEIMVDDLRDYRFYGADLIHPNQMAEDYIWELFKKAFMTSEDQLILERWDKLKKALDHRPRHPQTIAYKKFLNDTLDKTNLLSKSLNLEVELQEIKSLLSEI